MNKCAGWQFKMEQIAIRSNRVQKGIEVVQAQFKEYAFTPHRHDDYVIGVTDHGEQRFQYRGTGRCARAGNCFVIHPDELHDGRPGTNEGYRYRAIYLRPSLISNALHGGSLPFVPNVVTVCPKLRYAVEDMLSLSADVDEDLETSTKLVELADVLLELSGKSSAVRSVLNVATINRIKEQLESDPASRILMQDLEASYGMSRFSITRQFKQHLGTTPHRFLVMRRLEYAKESLLDGASIADVAIDSGFSDQSHFTRHFRHAFGISPCKWLQLSRPLN